LTVCGQSAFRKIFDENGSKIVNTMTCKGYNARMDFDKEDKIIVGRVLDIDDIITFHGTSVAEFEEAFHVAVDGYIAACSQLGQAPESPASGCRGAESHH